VLLLERKRRKAVEEVSKNNRAVNARALLSPDFSTSEAVLQEITVTSKQFVYNFAIYWSYWEWNVLSRYQNQKVIFLCFRSRAEWQPIASSYLFFVANRSFGRPTRPGVLALLGTITISSLHRNFCPAIFLPYAARLTPSFPRFFLHLIAEVYSYHIVKQVLIQSFSMMFCRSSLKGALVTCYSLPRPIIVTLCEFLLHVASNPNHNPLVSGAKILGTTTFLKSESFLPVAFTTSSISQTSSSVPLLSCNALATS